jgi:putative FmdB family regulatory protein
MPIYAYRCSTCGHAKDVLQKMSDPLLTVCPECGASTFVKQVTAAGFQLKGSGWYVTDFHGGDKGAPTKADAAKAGDKAETGKGEPPKSEGGKSEASAGESSGSGKSDAAPAPAASSPAPAPAPSTPSSGTK